MINVAYIKYLDQEQREEVRGYSDLNVSTPGIAVFSWPENQEAYIVTLNRVENIFMSQEEE